MEYIIGIAMVALFLWGFSITTGAGSTERIAASPDAFLMLFMIVGICIAFATIMLKSSTPAAKAAKIPGAGCGGTLAMVAVIIVVILFFVAGILATMGGG